MMIPSFLRTVRYARTWVTGRADLIEVDTTAARGDIRIPATLRWPRGSSRPLPAWILMHGMTRPGRAHAQLVRFTRALASTGAITVVPEVPEWRALDLAPGLTVPTVKSALEALGQYPDMWDGRVGIVGFSFGAPHAIAAAGHPDLVTVIGAAIGFGGYCDLERSIRCMMTGEHEWEGTHHHIEPDPYGRWIVAANYLSKVPGHEDADDVAEGLRRLAALAGDVGSASWDPVYDPAKAEARADLAPERRALFDLFAPPTGTPPDREAAITLSKALAATARRVDPEIEPAEALSAVRCPVHVIHGRRDHLIPFSEGLRLRAALAPGTPGHVTVTRLFGHSAQDPFPPLGQALSEVPMFVRALTNALGALR